MSLARHRELLLLGAVRSHEVHGYALVEALALGLGMAVGIKRPTVYALLTRLEQRGLLTHRSEKDSARPERRVYRVTKEGRRAIAGLVQASAKATVRATVPLAVIIAHLDEFPREERRSVLENCRDDLQAALAGLAAIPEHEGPGGAALDLVRRHYELDLNLVARELSGLEGS